MSHFSKIKTEIVDLDALLAALKELGFGNVAVYKTPQELTGWMGVRSDQMAEVVIRGQDIAQKVGLNFETAGVNDLGFRRTEDGSYEAIIANIHRGVLGEDWLNKVSQRYAEQVVMAKMLPQGFVVAGREVDPVTQKVHLILRRST